MVHVTPDIESLDGRFVTYPSGTEAQRAFQNDVNLSARYFAISGNTDAAAIAGKAFRIDQQYSFFSFNAANYEAYLRNYQDYLAERGLLNRLQELVTPFPTNPSQRVLRDYKAFFMSFGTHIITTALYGARYQLVSQW
jgi:hypothetical protein